MWPYDGLVSGAAALHALGYDVNYADMVDRFEVYYRTPNGTVGGYGSQTNVTTGSGTRFYDDNSIVGIELVEAFNLLNNQDYLTISPVSTRQTFLNLKYEQVLLRLCKTRYIESLSQQAPDNIFADKSPMLISPPNSVLISPRHRQ